MINKSKIFFSLNMKNEKFAINVQKIREIIRDIDRAVVARELKKAQDASCLGSSGGYILYHPSTQPSPRQNIHLDMIFVWRASCCFSIMFVSGQSIPFLGQFSIQILKLTSTLVPVGSISQLCQAMLSLFIIIVLQLC